MAAFGASGGGSSRRLARGFEEEPRAAFSFIYPDFDHARGGVVVGFGRHFVGGAQAFDKGLVVGVELNEHVVRGDKLLIVVVDALQAGDMPDRADGSATDFTNALSDVVADGEDLRGLLVEEQMVIAEVRPAHMPVEVLGFEI